VEPARRLPALLCLAQPACFMLREGEGGGEEEGPWERETGLA
jgi:hypothetical protein